MMDATPPAKLVCAAIRVQGRIILGIRHYDDFMRRQLNRLGIKKTAVSGDDQGFVDACGNYLTRAEAAARAYQTGQTHELKPTVFSEDLW